MTDSCVHLICAHYGLSYFDERRHRGGHPLGHQQPSGALFNEAARHRHHGKQARKPRPGRATPLHTWGVRTGRRAGAASALVVVLGNAPVGEECPDQQGRRHDQVEQPPIVPDDQ